MIRTPLILATALVALPLGACSMSSDNGRYGYNRPSSGYNGGYASREDRRDARRYERRRMARDEQIYRDNDGHYYCKRSDGTTGTVAGAIVGGVLGNLIAPGGSKTVGTILGAGGGALAGRAIDKGSNDDITCE